MQPDALAWYKDPARGMELPLATNRSVSQPTYNESATYAIRPDSYRRRLEITGKNLWKNSTLNSSFYSKPFPKQRKTL